MTSSAATGRYPAGGPSSLPEGVRRSPGLETLTGYLDGGTSLQVLDLGGINQANLDFLAGTGHRLYAEDLLRSFDAFFTPEEIAARDYPDERVDAFVRDTLEFPDGSVHAALLWDTLQFVPAKVADAVLERLHRAMAVDGMLLAFFHPENSGLAAVPHSCRIADKGHLSTRPRGFAKPIQPFNARSIERFFQRFTSVKFFMTRESLQEVVIRR